MSTCGLHGLNDMHTLSIRFIGQGQQSFLGRETILTAMIPEHGELKLYIHVYYNNSEAFDESVRRNPTQPVYLLEREGHLLLTNGRTRSHNHSNQSG